MKQIAGALRGLALSCCMLSNLAEASIIQSMTVEEIGVASGGLGSSVESLGGGRFAFTAAPLAFASFTSADSIDSAILLGIAQGDDGFTPGFLFVGATVKPNTQAGAPTGEVVGGNLILDLSGWGINAYSGFGYFPLPPDIAQHCWVCLELDTASCLAKVKDRTGAGYTRSILLSMNKQ